MKLIVRKNSDGKIRMKVDYNSWRKIYEIMVSYAPENYKTASFFRIKVKSIIWKKKKYVYLCKTLGIKEKYIAVKLECLRCRKLTKTSRGIKEKSSRIRKIKEKSVLCVLAMAIILAMV